MKWKTWAPVAIAIVLGGVAAKIAMNQVAKSHASAGVSKTVQVVVAKVNVGPGQELTTEQLALTTLAAPAAPADAFTATGNVVGRVLTIPLLAGQTVLEPSLAPKGTLPGLPSLVPPGMRAITLDVNESNGIAGMLQPGCRVDIITTIHQPQKNGALLTRTVVQNALVQAIGQLLSSAKAADDGKPVPMFRTVTMVVTAHEAEIIELANSSGRFRLTLRGSGDHEDADPKGVTEIDLLGRPDVTEPVQPQPVMDVQSTTRPAAPAVEVAETTKRTVELIEGTKSTKVVFEMPQQQLDAGSGDLHGQAVPNVGDELPER
ncbi:MAG: Flp pilus assembly protein CpaB [Phycisphaerales bacterium]|nr:Flp pilus assembly protein CpaB [Phycisphaerales bacterium]